MNYRISMAFFAAALALPLGSAFGQLGGTSGVLNGAGGRAAGNASAGASVSSAANAARLQTQLQQRIQAQAQVLQRAQSQTQRAANSATRSAEAQRRAATSHRLGVNANLSTESQAGVGNTANVNSRANANVRANAGANDIDVALFDSVLGRFNPFRNEAPTTTAAPTPPPSPLASNNPAKTDTLPQSTDGSSAEEVNDRPRGLLNGSTSLATSQSADINVRVHEAVRLRRAEISEMRDRALVSANSEMMANADRMESMLDTFETARARAASQAAAEADGRAGSRIGQRNVIKASGQSNVDAQGRFGKQPQPRPTNPSAPPNISQQK